MKKSSSLIGVVLATVVMAGCATRPAMDEVSDADLLVGAWRYAETETGTVGEGPSKVRFKENGRMKIGDAEPAGYQVSPPYLILWGLQGKSYLAPEAIYYSLEQNPLRLRLVTDAGTFVFTKQND